MLAVGELPLHRFPNERIVEAVEECLRVKEEEELLFELLL